MGLFDGIGKVDATTSPIYFLSGSYIVEVIKCFTMTSRKKDDLFIVETLILESDNGERKPGTKASWCVNFKQDAALGNIKGFVAACNGIKPTDNERVNDEITDEICEFAVDEKDNPLAGVKLKLVCVNKKTKEDKDFTVHMWDPIEEAA